MKRPKLFSNLKLKYSELKNTIPCKNRYNGTETNYNRQMSFKPQKQKSRTESNPASEICTTSKLFIETWQVQGSLSKVK